MLVIITVNYNCAERTLRLLRSLERQTNRQFSVIVVDNDSRSADRAALGAYAAVSPLALDILHSRTNLGFSGGNNLAIRKALAQGASWTLLINPDTEVGPEFVARIHQATDDEPAVWGLPLQEGERRTAYAGRVRWLRATLPHVYAWPLVRHVLEEPLYAIGAGMLVHRDAWDRIGLLDERYFLYFEDADFGLRARAAGIPVRFLREPVIRHAVSASTGTLGGPLLLRYHIRNALLMNASRGPLWARISLHFWALSIMLKQAAKLVSMPARRPQSRAILAGIADFYARRFGRLPDPHRH